MKKRTKKLRLKNLILSLGVVAVIPIPFIASVSCTPSLMADIETTYDGWKKEEIIENIKETYPEEEYEAFYVYYGVDNLDDLVDAIMQQPYTEWILDGGDYEADLTGELIEEILAEYLDEGLLEENDDGDGAKGDDYYDETPDDEDYIDDYYDDEPVEAFEDTVVETLDPNGYYKDASTIQETTYSSNFINGYDDIEGNYSYEVVVEEFVKTDNVSIDVSDDYLTSGIIHENNGERTTYIQIEQDGEVLGKTQWEQYYDDHNTDHYQSVTVDVDALVNVSEDFQVVVSVDGYTKSTNVDISHLVSASTSSSFENDNNMRYLDKVYVPYHIEATDESGWGDNRPQIQLSDENGSQIWYFTQAQKETYSETTQDVINEVLPYLFSVLPDSSTEQDLESNKIWTDIQPELHVGLNNDLFKAIETEENLGDLWLKIDADSELTNDQKNLLNDLVEDYKVYSENYDYVRNLVLDDVDVSDLTVPSWSVWLTDPELQAIKDLVKKYDDEILQFLNNLDEITFDYIINGEEQSVSINTNNPNELVDVTIPITNESSTNSLATVEIIGFNFQTINPSWYGHDTDIENIKPFNTENLQDYYINYDQNTYTYKVLYQPNSLDISNGIWIFTNEDNVKYDDEFYRYEYINGVWTKQNEKLYESFLYEIEVDGEIKNIPFYQNSSDLNIETWVTNIEGEEITLSQYLSNMGLLVEEDKVIYVFNQDVNFVVNPYQYLDYTDDGLAYWTDDLFQIAKIVDVDEDGQDIILYDWTEPLLSNSFNLAFGIDILGRPNSTGYFNDDDFHNLRIDLEGYPTGDKQYRFIIDKSLNDPVVSIAEPMTTETLYWQEIDENGNPTYKKLYTSYSEVEISLSEIGLTQATLSWVDSEGIWYEMDLLDSFVNYEKSNDIWIQTATIIIDYQGLFKISFTDLAGNTDCFYIWIQEDYSASSLIAFPQLTADGEDNFIAQGTLNGDTIYWLNSQGANDQNLIINNVLAGEVIGSIYNFETNQWEEITNMEDMVTPVADEVASVGVPIGTNQDTNNLAGDELIYLVANSVQTTQTTDEFKKVLINNLSGLTRYTVSTNIYKQNSLGDFVEQTETIYVYDGKQYDWPLKSLGDNEYDWIITEYEPDTTYDENNVHTHTEDDNDIAVSWDSTENNSWKYVPLNYEIFLVYEFIQPGSWTVEYSPLWYSWYVTETPTLNSDGNIILDKEGKYKITYTDMNGNVIQINYLVFDWPRNFTTYTVTSIIEENGKPTKLTQTFYENQAIATVQDANGQALEPSQIQETAYFYGDWINLYEESGQNEDLLVDHDNDPNTPDVPLVADLDYFEQDYAEWIANGGNPEDYWDQWDDSPDDEDDGEGDEEDNPDDESDGDNPDDESDGDNPDDESDDEDALDNGNETEEEPAISESLRISLIIGGTLLGVGLLGATGYVIRHRYFTRWKSK